MMMIMSQCEIVSGKDETKMKSPLLYRISYKSSHSQIYCISYRQHPKYRNYRLFVLWLSVVCCLFQWRVEINSCHVGSGKWTKRGLWLTASFLPAILLKRAHLCKAMAHHLRRHLCTYAFTGHLCIHTPDTLLWNLWFCILPLTMGTKIAPEAQKDPEWPLSAAITERDQNWQK